MARAGASAGKHAGAQEVRPRAPASADHEQACEHAFAMTFADALLLLFELADREDPRFRDAAARWHARFVLEASLPLVDSEMVLGMLSDVRGANRLILRRRLLERVERAGLGSTEIPAGG